LSPDTPEQHALLFPRLSEFHLATLAERSNRKTVQSGEVLFDRDTTGHGIFIVLSGNIEIFGVSNGQEAGISLLAHGEFTGELTQLSGRRSLVSCRATSPGEVLQISRETLRTVMQSDAALGNIFLSAFVQRRLYLIANDWRRRTYRI
jgi:thioredoxin reductase (NADPH)